MGEPLVKLIEARFVVPVDVEVEDFLRGFGYYDGACVGVTELQADGFGHLLPKGFAEVFLDEPQATEVQRALETGEVS